MLGPDDLVIAEFHCIDLKKAITLSQDRDLYNEMVVDRVMAKAVENYLPVDGDPEQGELFQDRD